MAYALFDLDALFEPDWAEPLGRRAFLFDAFLSHNRFDHSADVAVELQRRGLSVWHDAHADMADRKVLSKVSRAIRASRYVLVCIGRGFHDTPWVRAEYRPALTVERRGGLGRVVVLRMDADVPVPDELADAPLFEAPRIDELSSFLREGNLLPTDPTEIFTRARVQLDRTQACVDSAASVTPSAEEDESAARLRRFLHSTAEELEQEAGADIFSQGAFYLRNLVGKSQQTLPPPLSEEGIVLRRLALRLGQSPDLDNRANGAMLLRAIDERWKYPETLGDLLANLCLERDSSVIDTAIGHLVTVAPRMTAADLETVSVIALRSPNTLFGKEFDNLVALLPEAVRCRIHVREALGGLSPSERLSLIGERLGFLLARLAEGGSSFADSFGAAGPLLSLTDLELLARETCLEVLRFRPLDLAFAAEVLADRPLLEGALRVIEQIATPSCEGHRAAIHAMAEWVLDFLIIPLTLYRPLPELWPRARLVAEHLCDTLAVSDKVGREVPCYRALVAEIDAGASTVDARWRLQLNLAKT